MCVCGQRSMLCEKVCHWKRGPYPWIPGHLRHLGNILDCKITNLHPGSELYFRPTTFLDPRPQAFERLTRALSSGRLMWGDVLT